jgi:hypothetical protein
MGNDLGFLCTHCGFSESLSIGGGNGPLFRYPSIDTLVKAVGKKEARVLRTLEETQGAFVREMPVEAYYTCPKCKTLHSHLYYEVIYDGGKKVSKNIIVKNAEILCFFYRGMKNLTYHSFVVRNVENNPSLKQELLFFGINRKLEWGFSFSFFDPDPPNPV